MPTPRVLYISGEIAPTVTIEGLEETLQMFDDLPRGVILAGFTNAFRAGGSVLMNEVDQRTPIRLGFEGGDLTVEGGDLKAALMMTDPVLDSGYRGGYIEVGFGNQGYIANFLEYGHRMVAHDKLKILKGPRTPEGFVAPGGIFRSAPFMRPAFDAGKDRAIEAFTDSLAETVQRFKAAWGMPAAA